MSKVYIGVDNGVSGSIGIVGDDITPMFIKTPAKKVQDYTKKKKLITRLDWQAFMDLLAEYDKDAVCVLMERPLINPTRFVASTSALRCHEAELMAIELLELRHIFIDSKEWQKVMLPKGCNGEELKKASRDIGDRLFPQFSHVKHPDRDGLLIAEYARRKNL